MTTISTIVQGAIDRLQACIPIKMKNSVIRFPDKPEQFTHDVVKQKHPHGALLVKHLESGNDNGSEAVIVGVAIVAETSIREEKLAEAVRGYLNKYQISGLTKYEFAFDRNFEAELGIICRTVAYSCKRPAVPANDIEAFNAALNL